MLDIKLIRESSSEVQKAVKKKGYDIDINKLLKLDEQWRQIKYDNDTLRADRNKISKEINELKKSKKNVDKLIKEAQKIPEKIKDNEERQSKIKVDIDYIMHRLPNIPAEDVPEGGEEDFRIEKEKDEKPKFNFQPKHHWELGEELDIIDTARASKLSGSGFYILKGEGAQLQRALVQFMLDTHIKNGFTEINPPQLVLPEVLFGTGNLPKFEQDLYKTNEGLYLIPTAEPSLANIHMNETLKESELPKKYAAFTECYRTEAGRHGTETRGIFRLHQFEKVEMVYICKEEDSWKYLEEMTKYAEKIIEELKIPYRRITLAAKDMSLASAKTYDLEVWSPALNKYLEASSCSNCTDFQARRMNTRYQSKGALKFVHTLNGSGLALPRLMISLIENYQNKDGSITIPKVLQPYMQGKKKIEIKK